MESELFLEWTDYSQRKLPRHQINCVYHTLSHDMRLFHSKFKIQNSKYLIAFDGVAYHREWRIRHPRIQAVNSSLSARLQYEGQWGWEIDLNYSAVWYHLISSMWLSYSCHIHAGTTCPITLLSKLELFSVSSVNNPVYLNGIGTF